MGDVNNITFPKEAAENKPTVIELAGKQYQFREPPKMRADALLARLRRHFLDLAHELEHISKSLADVDSGNEEAVNEALSADPQSLYCMNELASRAPDIWSDVAKALGISNKKAEQMEADVGAYEVVMAAMLIMGRLNAPFAGGQQNTGIAEVVQDQDH